MQEVTPPRTDNTIDLSNVPSASPVNRAHDSWARTRAHDPPTVTVSQPPVTPVVSRRVVPDSSTGISNPIKRVAFTDPVEPSQPSPMPHTHVNASGTNPFRASTDNPIIKPFCPSRSPYMLRSRAKIPASASLALDEDEEHLLRVDEVPFDASAFLASAPYLRRPGSHRTPGPNTPTRLTCKDAMLGADSDVNRWTQLTSQTRTRICGHAFADTV
jgi:hypothetical protein